MSKIFVKSLRTGNLVAIPVEIIEEVRKSYSGTVIVRRNKDNLLTAESVEEVQSKIEVAVYGKPRTQQTVVQQVQVVQRPAVRYVAPAPTYRPESRSDSIIDTAIGVGAGMVLGDIVSDFLEDLF